MRKQQDCLHQLITMNSSEINHISVSIKRTVQNQNYLVMSWFIQKKQVSLQPFFTNNIMSNFINYNFFNNK